MMRAGALVVLVMLSGLDEASAANEQELKIGGGNIRIEFASVPWPSLRKLVIEWVTTSARAVSIYYERFPVRDVRIRIRFFDGHGTRFGRANGWNGALITMDIGILNNASDFAKDWELTHEMVHLAFPSVPESHRWIEEGIATYVEPIARARAGHLTAEKVWGDLVDGLPQGLPKAGDRGLDFTPTWGRTYWGGALFCLLADVEIRKRTQNTKGLEHALRAILEAGGTIASDWSLTKALRIGDDATGVGVLSEFYEKMRAKPVAVDLQALWRQLGVEREGGRTQLSESAPLAEIRRVITRKVRS